DGPALAATFPRTRRPRLAIVPYQGWRRRPPLVRAASAAGSRLIGAEIVFPIDLDLAGDPPAVLDLDLAVGDLAGNMTGRADQQPLADHQITLEATAHL